MGDLVDSGLAVIMLNHLTISACLFLSLPFLQSARSVIPSVEVEDDNESAGTRWRNTTTTATTETPGIYYEEHPQHYPHQLIMKLLQNFTAVPGLFDTGENRDLLRVVHHNNLDVDLEILK